MKEYAASGPTDSSGSTSSLRYCQMDFRSLWPRCASSSSEACIALISFEDVFLIPTIVGQRVGCRRDGWRWEREERKTLWGGNHRKI